VDLTSDDVQDILRLLDDLPFGEMRLQTSRFTLVLRRAGSGEWTQEMQVHVEPAVLPPAPGGEAEATRPDGQAAANTAGGQAAADTGGGQAGADTGGGQAAANTAGGQAGAENGGAHACAREDSRLGAASVAAGGTEAAGVVPGGEDGLVAVRAPLPGTFYRAPQPGAPPFVEVGSPVEPDTVVGIVETMKLMNSVSAQASGTVAQIVVGNAESAQRDAVLMWIRGDR
jgi:acetyl-CoA carboxylase biotin carboxyl carrier protein